MIKFFIVALLIGLGWGIGITIGRVVYDELNFYLGKLHRARAKSKRPKEEKKIGF